MAPFWTDDFSERSLDDLLAIETENRAWSQRLRYRVTALVDSRLAKQIGLDEYTESRRRVSEQAAECTRRRTMLLREIRNREGVGHNALGDHPSLLGR